ncbi:MAG: tetratricopeptide repeat protein [Bacteroidetes bacterium]|nr:tetratricopeptide repeat protein [Bacteroidota bacterium]
MYNKGDYEKSIDYYQRSLKLVEESGNKMEMSVSYNNIGNINYDKNKLDDALAYYEKSLKIKEELKYKPGVASSLYNIGNVHRKKQDYDRAISYYTKSNKVAAEINLSDVQQLNYDALANVYAALADYQKAFEYYKMYVEGSEAERPAKSKQICETQNKYDVTKKEKQIHLLQEELRKQKLLAKFDAANKEIMLEMKDLELKKKETEMKRQQALTYSFILGFIIIFIFSILLYRQSNQRRIANRLLAIKNTEIMQQKEEIEAQRDEIENQRDFVIMQKNMIEEQKKEITDSIVYASLIQDAILPPEKIVRQALPDHFVFYLPRDIVSGDFYWITQKEEDTVIVVADCTGHGVPGAFMSMLGIATLNEIVYKKPETTAGEILNELRLSIIHALHQKEGSGTKDGMDVALCLLNNTTHSIQYAGAFNPLILIKDGQLKKVSADRMPIGIHHNMDTPFTNNEIQLKKNDTIYLFSDGYPDQFGGEEGKKLKSKAFYSILENINQKEMSEQKEILVKEFNNWKGTFEQIDDILVMGIRI